MERSFPASELECRLCQFWPKVKKSDVEQRANAITGVKVIEDSAFFSYTCILNACKDQLFRSAIVMSVKTSLKIDQS